MDWSNGRVSASLTANYQRVPADDPDAMQGALSEPAMPNRESCPRQAGPPARTSQSSAVDDYLEERRPSMHRSSRHCMTSPPRLIVGRERMSQVLRKSCRLPTFVKTPLIILGEILESGTFQGVMVWMIIFNAVVIGLETDYTEYAFYWDCFEAAFLVVFAMELLLKMIAFGPTSLFSPASEDCTWNLFDAAVVSAGIVDLVMSAIVGKGSGGLPTLFRLIRILRIVRIFRVVRFLKQLYLLIYGFVEAAKAIVWISLLMSFVCYVCAIVLVRTVGQPIPDSPHNDFLLGKYPDIPTSMFTLFELMASPTLQEYHSQPQMLQSMPVFTMFLIVWVIFGSFGMIALLTGVISESMFAKNQIRLQEARTDREKQHRILEAWCKESFDSFCDHESGQASTAELEAFLPKVTQFCIDMGTDFAEFEIQELMHLIDDDETGTVSAGEFSKAIIAIIEGNRPASMCELRHQLCLAHHKIESTNKSIQELTEQVMGMADGFDIREPKGADEYGEGSARHDMFQQFMSKVGVKTEDLVEMQKQHTGAIASMSQTLEGLALDMHQFMRREQPLTASDVVCKPVAHFGELPSSPPAGAYHATDNSRTLDLSSMTLEFDSALAHLEKINIQFRALSRGMHPSGLAGASSGLSSSHVTSTSDNVSDLEQMSSHFRALSRQLNSEYPPSKSNALAHLEEMSARFAALSEGLADSHATEDPAESPNRQMTFGQPTSPVGGFMLLGGSSNFEGMRTFT